MKSSDPTLPRRRLPRHLWTVSLLGLAGLSAWAGYLSADASTRHPLQALAQSEHRLVHEIKSGVAREYSAIRPADTDNKPPPIPPSETWPAQ